MPSQQRKCVLMQGEKDRLPADTQPGVVYALGCKDCPKIYIGETARTAKKRAEEHLNHAKKGNTEMSAVTQHTLINNHAIHWKPRVGRKENNTQKRKSREALTIHRLGAKTINQDKSTNLSKLWLNVVSS